MTSLLMLARNLKLIAQISPFLAGYLFSFWGSFLNVLGIRLVHNEPIALARSSCPQCKKQLVWYELVPLLSWLLLAARCSHCKKPISPLYPAFELLTGCACTLIMRTFPTGHSFGYLVFVSALIASSRSDLEKKLISRFTSLYLVPVGIGLSCGGYIEISTLSSVSGAFFGFFLPYSIARTYYWYTGTEGLGVGDCDLLALIGSFLGIAGAWCSLVVASCLGFIVALPLILLGYAGPKTALPFGPFLALGAFITLFYKTSLVSMLIGY